MIPLFFLTDSNQVHYDQIFLRYGDPTSVTAWVPMGDIKLNGGGLIYLENGTFFCHVNLHCEVLIL